MLAQNSVWLADLRGTASFVRISGLHDGSVGDSFVWHRAVSNTSDSTVTGADAWCYLNLDIEWIDPGESTCESPARLAPGDSAFFRWESVIIAPPDSSLATARDDWLWPTVLYSWEVGTDSLRELPSVHDLDQITRIELLDAQIQGASGAPATLQRLTDRYATIRFRVFIPADGTGALRACPQHRPLASSGCSFVRLEEFESPWTSAAGIADALEEVLPGLRDRLLGR